MMPIMQAVTAGNLTLVKWLLHTNGGELRRRLEARQIQGHLALGGAGSPEVVKYLVSAGADPNERMPTELTEMGHGMLGSMGELYDQGSKDVLVGWCANYKGMTPLHEAAYKGSFSVVRALCECQADPTLTNARGFTPADMARARGLEHIAVELETHIVRQAREREAAAKKALPAAAAPPKSRPRPQPAPASVWSFLPASWKSAICCTSTDAEHEVSTLVPVEVPGFAIPRGKVSKDLSAVSTDAGSDDAM
jgi:hypothetical protein